MFCYCKLTPVVIFLNYFLESEKIVCTLSWGERVNCGFQDKNFQIQLSIIISHIINIAQN